MKKNKIKSQQLSLSFDNVVNRTISFQLSYEEKTLSSNINICKIISLDYYNQKKENELLDRFYSLSDHLE